MTTQPTTASGRAPVPESRARFCDLVAAEWTKLWSLRSSPWAYAVSAASVLGFNVAAAYDTARYWTHEDAARRGEFMRQGLPLDHAFTANAVLVLMLAAGALGAVTVVSEYSSGLVRSTFAAVPARRSVMAAKVVVVTAATTGLGALIAGASFALTQAVLSGPDVGVSLGHPGAWRVVAASALLTPVCALVGLAIGSVVRHMGATLVGTVVVLLLLPFVVSADRHWAAVVTHALPAGAWDRLVDVPYSAVDHPWTTSGAWTVYAVWALAAAAVAVAAGQRRDC